MKIGDQIGHYQVVEHIGRGGMADVWSARDERLQRTVAIKTIMADLTNEETNAQFEHEARVIASLEHSHILPIYDFGEFERQRYIVMRYVAGGSLMDLLINQGHLADEDTVRIGEAIAQALERAHAEQIVHRDLKPANVLMDRFGTPYLADFGLAAVAGAGDEEGNSAGTLIYMPPEQMMGQMVDQRSDIYAFGIMVFQLLTGEFPFEGTSILCLQQLQAGEELPDPRKYRPELSEQVVFALRMATAMDMASRYDNVQFFMAAIKNGLLGQVRVPVRSPGTGVSPAEEPVPYDAQTVPLVDEDLLATARGPVDEALLQTIDFDSGTPAFVPTDTVSDAVDSAAGMPAPLREARQLYRNMVRAWARGQGRFLTGATHFATIHAYYSEAQAYDLELDAPGREALLRGAIEHNHGLDYWLTQVTNIDVQRVIFLHALRSDSYAARALAVQLLVDVPVTDAQNIPVIVGRLLHAETTRQVRLAIMDFFIKRVDQAILAGEIGRDWQWFAYTLDTDLLLAEQALNSDVPEVAEMAARVIGRLRSRSAVVHIADVFITETLGKPSSEDSRVERARQALFYVRDEVDSLPNEVSVTERVRTFSRLTGFYLTSRIGRLGLRYFTALLGTGFGLGLYMDTMFPSSSILQLLHLYRVIGNAQTFGLVAGLGGMLAAALPLRLAGSSARRPPGEGSTLWPRWARFLLGLLLGALVAAIAYLNFQVIALQFPDPKVQVVFFGGLGVSFGAALAATFRWPLWARLIAAVLTIYGTLLVAWQAVWQGHVFGIPALSTLLVRMGFTDAIIALRGPEQEWLFLVMAIFAAIGIWGPEVIDLVRAGWRSLRRG